ncbi:MAG: queuosine precursor transporter [Bacteroidia bacterium]|nr:queuosine precursor transporter [Bacteroidia bacterium]
MKKEFSSIFVMMCTLMAVCLVASNIFTTKVFSVAGILLTGDLLIFPVSYILNDCISEVYGYRKARFAIWMSFAVNFLFVIFAQIVVALPEASFWEGGEHFNYIFKMEIWVAVASLLAFLTGSTVNAAVMSKMKVADKGERFWLRAIVSSLAGDLCDSLVFMPIVFWSVGLRKLLLMILCQVGVKVLYETLCLPLTQRVVRSVKIKDATDVFDDGISYNPFKIRDL